MDDYLLSETHPVGRWKARFFRAVSFDETNVDVPEQGLVAIALSEDVRDIVLSPYGTKYIIEGLLETPIGSLVRVQAVWMIDIDEDLPRLVTAYPVQANEQEEV